MPTSRGRKKKGVSGVGRTREVDLGQKREQFVDIFFRKGVKFVDELIQENARLREQLVDFERKNAALRSHLDSDDAIRTLLDRIGQLEQERARLVERPGVPLPPADSYAERLAELESQLHDLANLYVAGYQLHATLELREVVRNLRELLHQLVGARSFAIYLVDGKGEELGPIVAEGCSMSDLPRIELGEGPAGKAFLTGETYVDEGPRGASRDVESPMACVPMRIGNEIVGVIVILDLLVQKDRLLPVDHELFKLLGGNAATALIGARLYSQAKGQRPTVEGYRSLL